MKLLEVKDMTMSFGGLIAVRDLTFHVDEDEVVGLIGPNGSGKTTVINCVAGFYTPRKGQVFLKGKNTTGLKPHEIAALGLGRTFQLTGLLAKATVLDNVLTGLHLKIGANMWDALVPIQGGNNKEKQARDRALEILNFVGLVSEKDKICRTISNYSRKRLGVAVALATNPSILLIDEAVAGLSAEETAGIMDLIIKIRESSVAMLLVEHNMRVVMGLCDRIIALNFGAKIAEGTSAEIQHNEEVQKAYLGGYQRA